MLVYSRIKLKAYKTNLFLFRGKRKKFYVPIEHVIQQAFIGIFRINSWGHGETFSTLFIDSMQWELTLKAYILTFVKKDT